MAEREPTFRSREEADAYLASEVSRRRGCKMARIDGAPADLEGSEFGPGVEPGWRIDVQGICAVVLCATRKDDWLKLKPGEYIYRFYFNGKQGAQDRGTGVEILRAIDANLAHEKERADARRELGALIESLGGTARTVTEFPPDLARPEYSHTDGLMRGGRGVVRADFPDGIAALFERPERRYFVGDYFLDGKPAGGSHDWSVGEVRHGIESLRRRAQDAREAGT